MSAAEIIEQIKALPQNERRRVFEFVEQTQKDERSSPIRFASDGQAREAGDVVVVQYSEVFKRLAE